MNGNLFLNIWMPKNIRSFAFKQKLIITFLLTSSHPPQQSFSNPESYFSYLHPRPRPLPNSLLLSFLTILLGDFLLTLSLLLLLLLTHSLLRRFPLPPFPILPHHLSSHRLSDFSSSFVSDPKCYSWIACSRSQITSFGLPCTGTLSSRHHQCSSPCHSLRLWGISLSKRGVYPLCLC